MKESGSGGTRIQSVSRAARLMLLVASLPESDRTAARLALALGTSLPTAYHLLNTLVDAGIFVRGADKRYHLGIGVGVLAAAYEQQSEPPVSLVAPLRGISSTTGESTYLSAWRHGELQVLARVEGTHAVRVAELEPGFSGAAHARASGKVLLAYAPAATRASYLANHPLSPLTEHTIVSPERLDEELALVRTRGYATEEEEFREGVGCVSVPVVSSGTLLGAFTVSAPIERYRHSVSAYVQALIVAADAATTFGSGAETDTEEEAGLA